MKRAEGYSKRVILVMAFLLQLLLLVGLGKCTGQVYRVNVLGSYAPQDNAIGIRVGYRSLRYGLYGSISHGDYVGFDYYNRPFYIKDHTRGSLGLMVYSSDAYLAFGLVRHWFGESELTPGINPRALEPISAEFGAGCEVGRFTAGFRFDPWKWEGVLEAGVNLFTIKR